MSTDNGITQLHNLDAERSVLGGLLLRPALIGSIALEVPDFFSPKHQAVFEVMRIRSTVGLKSNPKKDPLRGVLKTPPTWVAAPVEVFIVYRRFVLPSP